MGGLGYPRLSDDINSAKYSIQQRHTLAGGLVSANIDTLLCNGVAQSAQTPLAANGIIVHPREKLSSTCWANSLIHFAAAGDLFLCRQGFILEQSPSSTIISASMPEARTQPWRYVYDRQISQLGDLYSYQPGSLPIWHDFSKTLGRALSELQIGDPPSEPVHLRSKQFWLPSPDANIASNTIIEILGFTQDDPPLLNIRSLVTNNAGRVTRLQTMRPPSSTPLMGGSFKISLPSMQALGSFPSRVYLDPPPKGSTYREVGFISAPTSYTLHIPSILPNWLPQDVMLLISTLGPFSIFTDGSWSPSGPSWSHITDNSPIFLGAVGIAIISDLPTWRELPIITLQIINGQELESLSAYSMEVLGILVGLSLASQIPLPEVTILSDCQSAVKKLHKLRHQVTIRSKTRDASLQAASISHWNSLDNAKIKWIQGHPEREEPDASSWTREMWGNHLSDRVAAGELNCTTVYQYQNLYSNLLYLTPLPPMDALSLTQHLVPSNEWYFGNSKRQLISPSVMDRIHHRRLGKYLADRDKERFERAHLPPKWQHYNMRLAAKMWKMAASPALRNMKNRLIFDKHCHPGNMSKKIKDPVLYTIASKCPFCLCPDSASHWSVECVALPRSVGIRNKAIDHIRSLVAATSAEHTDNAYKSSICMLRDDFLSFLIGTRKSPEVWMGLWTSEQLSQFETHVFYPRILKAVLRKLFLVIGSILSDTIILLWQSRQLGEVELAAENSKNPIPNYVAPPYLFQPPNPDLLPHSNDELTAINVSASAPAYTPPVKVSLYKTTRRLKLTSPIAVVPTETTTVLTEEIVLGTSSSTLTLLVSSPSLVTAPLASALSVPSLPTPPISQSHDIDIPLIAQRDLELLTSPSTPINVLLSIPSTNSVVTPKISQFSLPASSCPPQPLQKTSYKRSKTGDSFDIIGAFASDQSNQARPHRSSPCVSPPVALPPLGETLVSSARMKTCQSPVRGHDPG